MFFTLLNEAWTSIGTNRLRTFLAMLGIVIGVASVVLMLAIGSGSRRAVQEAVQSLGSNMLIVTPSNTPSNRVRNSNSSSLTANDADAIALLPSVLAAAPATFGRDFPAAYGRLSAKTQVTGTTADFFPIRNWPLAAGDPFSNDDVRLSRRTAVIGKTVARKLFPDDAGSGDGIIGRSIHINGTPFQIVGILDSKGQGLDGRDQDDVVYIPITTAKSRLWEHNYVPSIVQFVLVQVSSENLLDQAVDDISSRLRQRHRLTPSDANDFTIHNLTALTEVAGDTARTMSLLLAAIASISLLVGGIGIMNIMLVTVVERTREIGIRKALGATEGQILLQFLLEAVMIACAGSFVGLVIGIGCGLAAEHWLRMAVEYNLWSAVMALGVAAGMGIASGMYPAWKAARLHPIEALRAGNG